ncbi:MAG: FAD-dependent oxidoreductase, partial [Saccharopolyspora sp.]|uniref:FAD-dependent oxidoreductase n=1 Tax=Saccharopolyspora sp. TaxID=33915 RepID=UPI0025F014B2
MTRVVIAGGGLAAARTCELLRRKGFDGEIVLLAAERRAPYDRPPLTKAALREEFDPTLRTDYEALSVDLRLGAAARSLHPAERVVGTDSGDVGYDALVIATGASPVRLPGDGPQLVVRTADDAALLRERLQPGERVVLVGASWISAEVATAALARGCSVTCVEAAPVPLGALGEQAVLMI